MVKCEVVNGIIANEDTARSAVVIFGLWVRQLPIPLGYSVDEFPLDVGFEKMAY